MSGHRRKVVKAGAFVLVGGVGVATLLWGKLRLLTDVPRTTFAEPEHAHPDNTRPDETTHKLRNNDPVNEPASADHDR